MPRPRKSPELHPLISRLLPGHELGNYPALIRAYPEEFEVDEAYRATLPHLQNGPESLIKGAKRNIEHVGISNFRLPIRFHTRDGGDIALETSVTGTVSLDAGKEGHQHVPDHAQLLSPCRRNL